MATSTTSCTSHIGSSGKWILLRRPWHAPMNFEKALSNMIRPLSWVLRASNLIPSDCAVSAPPLDRLSRMLCPTLLLLVSHATARAESSQQTSPICGKCHVEGRTQPGTDMGRAFETAERASILVDHPL